eukprot:1994381-Pleurochrysis_carterae.AAC.2
MSSTLIATAPPATIRLPSATLYTFLYPPSATSFPAGTARSTISHENDGLAVSGRAADMHARSELSSVRSSISVRKARQTRGSAQSSSECDRVKNTRRHARIRSQPEEMRGSADAHASTAASASPSVSARARRCCSLPRLPPFVNFASASIPPTAP